MKDLMKQICKDQASKEKDKKIKGARYKGKY